MRFLKSAFQGIAWFVLDVFALLLAVGLLVILVAVILVVAAGAAVLGSPRSKKELPSTWLEPPLQ